MSREMLPEYIFGFMPVLHRKLLKRRPHTELPRQKMNVLHKINFHDGRPMSYYCEEMIISKPNMTKLVNDLLERGMVTRGHDSEDRRVITIHITEKGREAVKTVFDDMKAQIVETTSVLSDEEINQLIDSFKTIKTIFEKLENNDFE